jgi:hypothetical protein
MADKSPTNFLPRVPRYLRIAKGDGPIVSDARAASKHDTAGPMSMQPRRKGDIIPPSDTRRDAPRR